MPKLYIIAGHGAGDSGAVGGGQTEAERVRALAQRIKELGGSDVEILDMSRNWYIDNGISNLTLPKGSMILELHRDSASSSARGAHIIIKSGRDVTAFDNALAAKLSAILPGRSEIIVRRSNLANANRAANKGYDYRLAEVGFISNATDREIFDTRIDEIARAILEAAGIGVNGSYEINIKENSMQCIFQPNDEGYLVFYDGVNCHMLGHPDEVEAIQMVARATLGKDLPMFKLGTKDSPWAGRFFEAIQRGL